MTDDRTDGQGSRAPGKEVDLEEVLRLDREVAQLRAELAWHEQMNGTRAEQEAHDAEADAVDAAAAALTPEQLRAEMIEIGLDPDRVEREAEVSARLIVRCMQARDERDAARAEADAFAVYRSLVTTALGIDPGSCADDVKEAIEELRLTLAAEQGKFEGAPSEGWIYDGRDWSKTYPDGSFAGLHGSRGKRDWMRASWPDMAQPPCYFGRGFNVETDRAAMIAADKATP